jgi:hypothetical protein
MGLDFMQQNCRIAAPFYSFVGFPPAKRDCIFPFSGIGLDFAAHFPANGRPTAQSPFSVVQNPMAARTPVICEAANPL